MPVSIGPWEIILLVVVMLLVFGPKRLPEVGRGVGQMVRELRDTFKDDKQIDPPEE